MMMNMLSPVCECINGIIMLFFKYTQCIGTGNGDVVAEVPNHAVPKEVLLEVLRLKRDNISMEDVISTLRC